MTDEPPASQAPSRIPRAVTANRPITWFADAIRLWKRGPFVFSAMAAILLVAVIVLQSIAIVGLVAASVLASLLACGFLYGSLAADRDNGPRLAHLVAIFVAPPRAQLAIVAAGLLVTMVESAAAWAFAGVNLFLSSGDAAQPPDSAVVSVYAASVLASLPVTFVPMAVLFDSESAGRAFALSWRAFVLNVRPMLVLGVYSYALLLAGLATVGVGFVLALPWIAAASYSAWKDIFGLSAPGSDDA